jgi:hypothetical protein
MVQNNVKSAGFLASPKWGGCGRKHNGISSLVQIGHL